MTSQWIALDRRGISNTRRKLEAHQCSEAWKDEVIETISTVKNLELPVYENRFNVLHEDTDQQWEKWCKSLKKNIDEGIGAENNNNRRRGGLV